MCSFSSRTTSPYMTGTKPSSRYLFIRAISALFIRLFSVSMNDDGCIDTDKVPSLLKCSVTNPFNSLTDCWVRENPIIFLSKSSLFRISSPIAYFFARGWPYEPAPCTTINFWWVDSAISPAILFKFS